MALRQRQKEKTGTVSELKADPSFGEGPAWRLIGTGWRPLFGSYHDLGFSFEWHEFTLREDFDWGKSFHPGSLELCLNLDGVGQLSTERETITIRPQQLVFYYQGSPPLAAVRQGGQNHRFITVEFSPEFLAEQLRKQSDNLHPVVRSVVQQQVQNSSVSRAEHLTTTLRQMMESLRQCPVFTPAREMWFRCKALEIASYVFFRPPNGEMLCTRAQRLARERVERAKEILKQNVQNPPTLEEMSRLLHCSTFYLSRQFTKEAGMTMQQYIRQIRMESAAELLRTGKCNVTEAAFQVGYNSLSHFSTTFHETFGCCPGLYPLKTPSQTA